LFVTHGLMKPATFGLRVYTWLFSVSLLDNYIIDCLSRWLSLPTTKRRRQIPLSTNSLNYDAIKKLWSTSPRLGKLPSDPDWVVTGCAQIAPDTVAKALSINSAPTNLDSEKLVMDLVRSCTDIPVPYCELVTDSQGSPFLVMEYIPGRMLVECWTELSWWTRLRIAFTLRRYIRQLRHIKGTRPGPLGGDQAREIEGVCFGEEPVGPFETYAELTAWFNLKMLAAKRHPASKIPEKPAPFDDSMPLNLTHHDLHMRNIILGDDGQLWIIDWGRAAFLPPWFEYVTMWSLRRPSHTQSWNDYVVPFVAGRYEGEGQAVFCKRIVWAIICRW